MSGPQLDLDFAAETSGLARHDAPDTSKAAALPKRGTQRALVLEALARCYPDGLTQEQLARVLSMRGDSVRPRLVELRANGKWVVDSGDRRHTTSGENAIVWRCTDTAVKELLRRGGA